MATTATASPSTLKALSARLERESGHAIAAELGISYAALRRVLHGLPARPVTLARIERGLR